MDDHNKDPDYRPSAGEEEDGEKELEEVDKGKQKAKWRAATKKLHSILEMESWIATLSKI